MISAVSDVVRVWIMEDIGQARPRPACGPPTLGESWLLCWWRGEGIQGDEGLTR